MTQLSKEQLLEIVETDHVQCGEASAMAKMLLAAEAQEPVAFMAKYKSGAIHGTCDLDDTVKMEWLKRGMTLTPLYAAPQPVTVPDEIESTSGSDYDDYYCDGWNACRAAMLAAAPVNPEFTTQQVAVQVPEPIEMDDDFDSAFEHGKAVGWNACRASMLSAPQPEQYQHLSELYHAQEKRLFKIAQRIKGPSFDKYAHSTSQAIDVLESAIFGENNDACRAAMLQGAEPVSQHTDLTVWYGSMPETNGKSNWTAILHRKGEGIQDGITIDRAEYPGRVLYAADRVRYLIGEKTDRPCILDYDGDKHSGYVKPVSQHDELPMEYLQGHKDGLEWAARLAEANHPQTGDWLYDDPLELAKAIRKGPDMPTAPVQAWIKCSERMPEVKSTVLVYMNEPQHSATDYAVADFDKYGFSRSKVTHWMPLPAAPQEPTK